MDYHFGKKKFRSGNIPFTMFGPFDQKPNVLFRDKTDLLKTKYELMKVTYFPRNIENYLEYLIGNNQQCKNSSTTLHKSAIYTLITVLFLRRIF